MGQWTDNGFVAGSVSDYKTQIQNLFTEAFGDDFIVDDDTLPQGILIQELAELMANADADSIQVLAQLNVNTMSGIWLDLVAMARGLKRLSGVPQVITVAITSDPAELPITLPQGHVFVCNETGDSFVLSAAKTISSASDTAQMTYASEGNSNVTVGYHLHTDDAAAITTMEIVAVSNGTERESDADFRTRLRLSAPVFNPTIEHITNEIKALSNIRGVGCAYNDTDTTTADGIPPYCTEFLVAPTPNVDQSTAQYDYWKEEVGKAILWNKVPGSPTYGGVTVNIEDPFGDLKDVSFSVPDKISLEVKITASVNEQSGAPDISQVSLIMQNVSDYINNLSIGVDVSYSKIMQIFSTVSTMDITRVTFKNKNTGTEYVNQNYVLDTREYAECSTSDVRIEY